MLQNIRYYLDAKLLTTDEEALKKVISLFSELEDKGFLKDSRIVFDSTQEKEVNDIFDHFLSSNETSKSETK